MSKLGNNTSKAKTVIAFINNKLMHAKQKVFSSTGLNRVFFDTLLSNAIKEIHQTPACN